MSVFESNAPMVVLMFTRPRVMRRMVLSPVEILVLKESLLRFFPVSDPCGQRLGKNVLRPNPQRCGRSTGKERLIGRLVRALHEGRAVIVEHPDEQLFDHVAASG